MTTHRPDPRYPISIRCHEDLLALIPHQLGYEPRDCAVLFIPVPGGGALCLKLRTPIRDADVAGFARELAEVLAGVDHAGQAAVVVYSTNALLDEAEADFLNAAWLGVAVERSGLRATSGLVVGPRHWWNLETTAEPQPVSAIADSALNAHMIALGSAVQQHAPGEPPPLAEASGERTRAFLTAVADVLALEAVAREGRTGTARGLARWDRAVGAVSVGTLDGQAILMDFPAEDLARLAVCLRCGLTRDALFYAWLTGDCRRAARAALALRAAVERLRGRSAAEQRGSGGPAGGSVRERTGDAEEGLRCARTVMGQWEGRPHWDSVEAAYRILEVLDSLFSSGATAGCPVGVGAVVPVPVDAGLPAGLARTHADVVSARAQLEVYRGRAFTASALLERGDAISAHRPSTVAVLRRLQLQDVPWWCKDPRTAWPGRHWWEARRHGWHAEGKYPRGAGNKM